MKLRGSIELVAINFRLCMMELWSNRTRSIITSLGIFLGVTSLLVNISFIRALDNNVRESMNQIGGLNIITIKNKKPANDEEKRTFARSGGLKLSEAEEIVKCLPYTRVVLPQIDMSWRIITTQDKSSEAYVFAVGPHHDRVYNIQIEHGTPLSEEDHRLKSNVCIIGKMVAKQLFGDDINPVGKILKLNRISFTVRGLIKTDDEYSWRACQLLFPYSFYKYHFGSKRMDQIAIELKNSDYVDQGVTDALNVIRGFHRGIEDIEVESNKSKIREMQSASVGLKAILICIVIITFAVGGISIMNIMLAAIGDRIREIGVRKALGARTNGIFTQFMIEAIFLCFIGGIPGMILGSGVVFFPKGAFPFNPVLIPADYVLAVIFIFVTGLLSGLFPALRAARMQPVEALRF